MQEKKAAIQFLVHDMADTVGVATVDLEAGCKTMGMYMDTREQIELEVGEDIPLGHKIALRDHRAGDAVIKYNHDIGEVVTDIKKARHVHVHNLKTRRW